MRVAQQAKNHPLRRRTNSLLSPRSQPTPAPVPEPAAPLHLSPPDEDATEECLKVLTSLLDTIESSIPWTPPPPPVDLLGSFEALMRDHELFHETFQFRSSEAFVKLQNMVDEVIHRNTVYPVPLMRPASVLEQDFSSFLSLADPVYIHMQSMLDDVEARIERENRQMVQYTIDRMISTIKRNSRR